MQIKYFSSLAMLTILLLGTSHQAFSKTLIVSDSHGTGAFGGELARLIEAQNESVSFYAFGGTKAIDWIEGNNLTWGFWEHHTGRLDRRSINRNTPKLLELIQTHRPHTVIIVLGTNMVWRQQIPEDGKNVQYLMNLTKRSGAKCIWVGPPDLKVNTQEQARWVTEIHQLLEQQAATNGCQLIDSWNFTNYPENSGDGIHYDQVPGIGARLAEAWAQDVFAKYYSEFFYSD